MVSSAAPESAGDALPAFELVPPGVLRDRLNDQVLRGLKTATSRLLVMDKMSGTERESAGTRMRLLDSSGEQAAVIEIARTVIAPFGSIGAEVSEAEGEWLAEPAEWRAAHTRYWTSLLPGIRSFLSDDGWELTDETPVIVRFFHLIKEDR